MQVRLVYPLTAYIEGESVESLTLSHSFRFRRCEVHFEISIETPLEFKNKENQTVHFCRTKSLNITIRNYQDEVQTFDDQRMLFDFCKKILTHIITKIKIVGMVTHIHPPNCEDEDFGYYLKQWNVEQSEDGVSWQGFLPTILDLVSLGRKWTRNKYQNEKLGTLKSKNWSEISESFLRNEEVQIEQEFIVNSLEYLDFRNYRLSLLESMISLEICTSNFLRKHLELVEKIPKKRVDEFLTPQLTLMARISALLNLCIKDDFLNEELIGNVRRAINWRNAIIHRTGKIPTGIQEKEIHDGIVDVITLCFVLNYYAKQIT